MRRGVLSVSLAALALAGCRSRRPEPPPPVPARLTLVAVGDILVQRDVQEAALQHRGFEPLWVETASLFQSSDLVFGNLETPVAPLSGGPGKPYLFNAPAELPEALRRSGFTILSTANNHSYDQGVRGLQETLTRLEVANLVAIGSGRDQAKALTPRILARNGIRIAFLAWTDLFNRQFNRAGQGPWVDGLEVEQACRAVSAARSQADAVVVSLHWGHEDQHEPSPRQHEVASRLFAAGADLILGHHPHVLQPLQVLVEGNRRVAVAFSLGNFISNQNRVYDADRMPVGKGDERDGAAVVATFIRTAPDRAELEKIGYIPLWTENNWREVSHDETKPREIRVVRLDAPGRQLQPWLQRRERIRAVMGKAAEIWTE